MIKITHIIHIIAKGIIAEGQMFSPDADAFVPDCAASHPSTAAAGLAAYAALHSAAAAPASSLLPHTPSTAQRLGL